jgi:hypothetical protein
MKIGLKKSICTAAAVALVGVLGAASHAQASALRAGAPVRDAVTTRGVRVEAGPQRAVIQEVVDFVVNKMWDALKSEKSIGRAPAAPLSTRDRELLFDAR